MRKCKSNLIKKMICLLMACTICSQFFGITTFAAQSNWQLVHSPSGTSSTNVISWSKTVTTTMPAITVSVTSISGGPTVEAYASNDLQKSFFQTGSYSKATKVGLSIYLSVYYTAYGSGYSSVKGNFSY